MAGIKIRLVEPGYENFTGAFSEFTFKNGVSQELTQREADKIACMMRVKVVEGAEKVGAARMIGNGDATAQKEEAVDQAEQTERVEAVGYTREELEAIADEDGIAGLREIGAKLGVNGRSIEGLIESIIETKQRAE